MTTRTKLNLAMYTSSTMGLLVVFSRPMRIPAGVQWALLIGMFVPLGLAFHYIKKLKKENAGDGTRQGQPATEASSVQKKTKKRFVTIWIWSAVSALSAPLWLPVTGVSLGTPGDFLVGVVSAGVVSVIFAVRLKKMPFNRATSPPRRRR